MRRAVVYAAAEASFESPASGRIFFSYSSALLMRSAGGLLDRAMAAGEIRNDIGPDDLIRTLVGMCYTHDQSGWQRSVLRLVDIFIDGLRNRAKRRTKTHQKNIT